MRRKPKRRKRYSKSQALTRVVIGGNVSGTHPYSADDAGARDPTCHAAMPQCVPNEAGWTSAGGERRCGQARAAPCIEEKLQRCDLAPLARDAIARGDAG